MKIILSYNILSHKSLIFKKNCNARHYFKKFFIKMSSKSIFLWIIICSCKVEFMYIIIQFYFGYQLSLNAYTSRSKYYSGSDHVILFLIKYLNIIYFNVW